MVASIISIYLLIYLGFVLVKLKFKLLEQFYTLEYKNYTILIILFLIFFFMANIKIIFILISLSILYSDQIIKLTKLVLLQTYYCNFKLFANNFLGNFLNRIDFWFNIIFFNRDKKKVKYIICLVVLLLLPLKLAIFFFFLNEVKNFYLYRMSHVYDSLIIGYYFNEEVILNQKGEDKLFLYKKSLLSRKKGKLAKIIYMQDYQYCDQDQNV